MHILLLKFSTHRQQAARFMEGHKAWIQRGFDDGVFLVAGSLEPGRGGALLAHRTSSDDLRRRVAEDPFVVEGVVTAEILEVDPGRADPRLQFLVS